MPAYDYNCGKCGKTWEETQRIANNKKPERKPCPHCGLKGVKQVVLQIGGIGKEMNFNPATKATGGFKDAMQKALEPMRGTKAAAMWKSKYGI
jgi:putative FmdB family regulatory protein